MLQVNILNYIDSISGSSIKTRNTADPNQTTVHYSLDFNGLNGVINNPD